MPPLHRSDAGRQFTDHVSQLPNQAYRPRQVWITTRQAVEVIGCGTVNAAGCWLRRHGIVRRSNGTVSVLDIQRELGRRSGRGRAAGTRAGWFKRKAV